MPIQITRLGTVVARDRMAAARAVFEREYCLRIQGFIEPTLLRRLAPLVEGAPFERRVHVHVDPPPVDSAVADPAVENRFLFLLNDPALFAAVRDITGCEPIGFYNATIYRMLPAAGHQDSWHDDWDGERMVALSINIGDRPYEGGLLQIRRKGTRELLHSVHNTGFGDAILFRLAPDIEHCITDVTGSVPKTALAGWFQRSPAYVPNLRSAGVPV